MTQGSGVKSSRPMELVKPQTTGSTTYNKEKKAEYIDQYVAAGYSLFPLNGKHPPKGLEKWQKTPYDPLLDASELPRNYGVVLKQDDIVVDVDTRNFIQCVEGKLIVTGSGKQFKGEPKDYGLEEGEIDNPLQRLFEDFDIPVKPNTYTVQSGRGDGGLHIYFKKPPDVRTRVTHPKYPGIDFKRRGHFMVGPGSIHPDTRKPYGVIRQTPSVIIDAPAEMVEFLTYEDGFEQGDNAELEDKGSKYRYITFLKNAPGAVESCQGDLTTYKCAAIGRDFGLSYETVVDLMEVYWNIKCEPPWQAHELRQKVKNAFQYAQQKQGALHPEIEFADIKADLVADAGDKIVELEQLYYRWKRHNGGKGDPIDNHLGNTVNYFLTADHENYVNPLYRLLRYNEFADQIEFNFPAPWHHGPGHKFWNDTDAVQLKYWLSQTKHYNTSTPICHEAAITVGQTLYRYHPVRQYLEKLEWDGVPRLDTWLTRYCGSPKNPYTKAIGKNTMIAAVARVFEPGCQHDSILILEGAQGTGKSSVVRILGGPWYKDIVIDPHNKDTVDGMRGGWVIEASEMEFAKRADLQALKAFITRVSDYVRPAYAKVTRDFPRASIIIGTINPEIGGGYLRDGTGNRRFWPVETNRINLELLTAERDQLWAEAYARYRNGEKYYLDTPELVEAATLEQSLRQAEDPFEEIIAGWMLNEERVGTLPDIVTSAEVASQALSLSSKNIDRGVQVRVSAVLQKLGWLHGTYRHPVMKKACKAFRNPVDWTDDL